MPKTLVLAEKPSVARELARVLGCNSKDPGSFSGGNYIVTWALGHLVTLADPETYDKKYQQWRAEDLPMLPERLKLVVIGQTSKQFRAVSSLLGRADVGDIVIATDAGREGELVARWILQKANCKKPLRRLWISSQTDKAIREGFAKLRPGREFDTLYQSAVARAEADWFVGLNVTRALTCKHNASLAAGRVQTPTLAMLVQREKEILNFRPKEYYTVRLLLEGYHAVYRDGKGNSRFFDRAAAETVLAAVQGQTATVSELRKSYKQQPPPPAYDLTELQRDANRRFGMSAKQTLSAMQSLYESHKAVTYPRTDSRYIPADVVPSLPERLRAVNQGVYQAAATALLKKKPLSTRFLVNDSKVTDHHAIIPTEQSPSFAKLTREEGRIYDLVVRRFLAVLNEPHGYDELQVTLRAGKYEFSAKGRSIREPGWKALYSALGSDEDEDANGEEASQTLPQITQGLRVSPKEAQLHTGKTRPPARYTEATLLTAMEFPCAQVTDAALQNMLKTAGGLGTPATRADIIEKLLDSFCMERRGKELHPTAKGNQLIEIVPPDLKSAALTAKWEQTLQGIAQGKENPAKFNTEMRSYAAALVAQVKNSDAVFRHDNITREACPDCGKYLLDVAGKKGRMLICQDRECGYRKSLSMTTNARCPDCHKKLELRGEGEKRMFTCICGFRERLSDFEKRKESAGANKRVVQQYMQKQAAPAAGNALAEQLAKWKESNE